MKICGYNKKDSLRSLYRIFYCSCTTIKFYLSKNKKIRCLRLVTKPVKCSKLSSLAKIL